MSKQWARFTKNAPDWQDVAAAWEGLERVWSQPIKMTVLLIGTGKFASLRVIAEMLPEEYENGVLSPCAYVQCDMHTSVAGGLEPELLALLYRLDFVRSEKKPLGNIKEA